MTGQGLETSVSTTMISIFATTYSKWKKISFCYLGKIYALMVKYNK